jgi:hypothetical protein
MTIPHWLQAHLEATGKANPDHVGRIAKPRRCPRCRTPILVGLDDDHAALPARVDPTTLDSAGELAALITERQTYNIWRAAGGYELTHRDGFHVAGARNAPVVAEHACGKPIPGQPLTDPTNAFPAAQEDQCPPF